MVTQIQFSKNGVTASLTLQVQPAILSRSFAHHSASSEELHASFEAYSQTLETDAVQQLPLLQSIVDTTYQKLELSLVVLLTDKAQADYETRKLATNHQFNNTATINTTPHRRHIATEQKA